MPRDPEQDRLIAKAATVCGIWIAVTIVASVTTRATADLYISALLATLIVGLSF
jgi:hypothetical protein